MVVPLMFNDGVRKEIKALIEKATNNPRSAEFLLAVSEGKVKIHENFNDDFTMYIPTKYSVTYTHEYNIGNVLCRHISISLGSNTSCPHPSAIQMILDEFGFVNKLDNLAVWIEDCGGGSFKAVNLLEPVSGNMQDIAKNRGYAYD
jgi:hypothetical protein